MGTMHITHVNIRPHTITDGGYTIIATIQVAVGGHICSMDIPLDAEPLDDLAKSTNDVIGRLQDKVRVALREATN